MSPTWLLMDSHELLDGLAEAIFLAAAIIAAIVTFLCGVALLGCWCAYRAARGSATVLASWLVIAAVEAFVQVIAVPPVYDGECNAISLFPAVALVAQAAVYVVARRRKNRASEPDPQPIPRAL